MKDPELSMCAASTRGIWADLICAMNESDQSGTLTGTAEQLSRLARCTASEMAAALEDLCQTGAAKVSARHGLYTVVNRRMSREYKKRKGNATRQLRKRKRAASRLSNAVVTGERSEVRGQKSEYKHKNPSPRRSATRPAKSADGSARASGGRTDLSEEVLADPLRLARWAEEEAGRSDGWISTSEADRANVVATAAKALRATGVRSRVGLFKWIVRGRRWEYLRFEDEQIAATILAAEPAKERASISEFVDVPSFKLPEADGISTEQRRADLRKQIEAAGKR